MPYNALDPATAQSLPSTTIGDPLLLGSKMSRAEFIQELRPLLQGRTDIEEDRYGIYLNLAYVDLVTSLKIPEAQASLDITLVEGQPLYLLPDSVQAITYAALHDPDLTDKRDKGRPLDKIDLSLYRGRNHHNEEPREFFRHGSMLVVWPTPDADEGVVSIDFRVRPRWMIQPGHRTILPSEWDEPLLWSTRHKLLEALQEWEAAAVAENTYIKSVRKRLDTEALEDDTRIIRSSVPDYEFRTRKPRLRFYGVD